MNTAIVTYGRGWPALAVVRSLGSKGVRVVCGDSVPMAPGTLSKYCAESFRYPDPKQDPEGFLTKLEDVVRENLARGGEVVLMPVHSETYLIVEHRARFEALGARMTLPDHEDIELTNDKGSLAVLAEELGITIPTTRRYTDMAEVFADAHRVNYPAFVKVRSSAAGCGIKKVESPEEMISAYSEFVRGYDLAPQDYPLVQEFVAGSDYCLSALFDHGRLVAIHTYRNLRQYPRTTGAGVLRETVRAPKAEAVAQKLLGHLGWHGLAQLDFRWDEDDDEPILIELNPRFFGGLPQAIAAGVDHPWMAYQLALDETPKAPEIDYEVCTETPILGLLATAISLHYDEDLRAKPSLPAAMRHVRGKFAQHKGTVNDVFRTDDPMPVLGVLCPVAVALKHGTLSTAVVLSEATMKTERVKKGLRGHLVPSTKTLAVTALVFVLSVLCTTWAVTEGTLVDTFFSLPTHLSNSMFPSAQAAAYGLFHMVNFCFLYVLAALGLKLREEVQASHVEVTA